jgi:hypothetical protein
MSFLLLVVGQSSYDNWSASQVQKRTIAKAPVESKKALSRHAPRGTHGG